MIKLTLLDADWPDHDSLVKTVGEVAARKSWLEVGVTAKDQRVTWIETPEGVDLFYNTY